MTNSQQQFMSWTLGRILDWTTNHFTQRQIDSPRLSAEMLLAHALNTPRIKLYTELQRAMIEEELVAIRTLVKRAGDHEPIQYLTGRAHFYGLEIDVSPDVLIPRPETETLVDAVIDHVKIKNLTAPRVLELCTGSGCVSAAIAKQVAKAEIVATDVSLPALDVARKNFARLGLSSRIGTFAGDLFDALDGLVDRRAFDLLLANPPYIRSEEVLKLDRNIRDHEPKLALDGGVDGLDVHRRILKSAHEWLASGARVLLEIAFDQEEKVLWIARQFDQYDNAIVLRDLGKRPRVLSLRRI